MAFANLLDPDTYAPRDKRNLSDLLDTNLKRQIEIAASNAATRQSDIHNDEGDLTLQQNKTIQPEVLRQLGLESAPQQLPPSLAANQTQPQDPYSAQASLMDEKQQMLANERQHPAALAMSPVLAAIDKQKTQNLEDRTTLSGGQLAIQKNRDWGVLKPQLDKLMVPPTKGWNALKGEKAIALDKAISAIPAYLLDHPGVKQWIADKKSEQQNAMINMAGVSTAPPPQSVIDNAIKRIANRESTISEEINKGRFSGATAMEIHDKLAEGVRAIDPTFSEADTEAGYSFAKNPATKRAITQLDNAYSTLDRLKGVYAKLNNGQFPTLNKAINAGKIQVGDVSAARAAIAEVLGNDELTQAFSRGGMGSDKLRDMSAKLADYNKAPAQMLAQFDEIMHGLERSRNAYTTQGGGYIKPLKTKAESAPQAHPQDSQAIEWAKANPNDPRSAKILKANGVQ